MAKEALASEDLAKKFATEKETPYTRWVKAEGLDIIPALYVRNLRTVDVKPWARRGGNAVFVNHDASRVSNDSYVMEIPPGKTLEPHRQLYEEMILVLEGRVGVDPLRMARRHAVLVGAAADAVVPAVLHRSVGEAADRVPAVHR